MNNQVAVKVIYTYMVPELGPSRPTIFNANINHNNTQQS